MKELTGIVEKMIYQSKETGYAVFTLRKDEADLFDNPVTVTGSFFDITEKDHIKVTGDFKIDPKYGKQFITDYYECCLPNRTDMLEKYLATGVIKGIGPARAKAIIEKFGEQTIAIMEEDPIRLSEIPGIGKRTAELIGRRMQNRGKMQSLMIKLGNYGIGPALGKKIYQKYKDRTMHIIQTNPYQLIEDIRGVGFKAADSIALENGVSKESPYRINSGLKYVHQEACSFGSVYVPVSKLKTQAKKILELDEQTIASGLDSLLGRGEMVCINGDRLYLKADYESEVEVALRVTAIARTPKRSVKIGVLKKLKGQLDEVQTGAVRTAAESGMMILTGGPGTGKTTTTNLIIQYFELTGKDVVLAAPTGRAAKRMKEATGKPASTIHRLLEVTGGENGMKFERNEDNPIDADVIIIDEVSMMDLALAKHLLRAIPSHAQLILVGDRNQLPSVGAGNVLADLIASNICAVVELTKIYRQAGDSDIISNAYRVLNGQPLNLTNRSKDFFFKPAETPEEITQLLVHYVADSLPGFTGESDIQVLSPIRGRALGVNQLNLELQKRLNPGKETVHGFRVGDKVIQTVNNYNMIRRGKHGEKETGVFNGDVGRVSKIDTEEEYLYVEFEDGWTVQYEFEDLDTLDLAYALTIHKSQGSEYPVVVIPVYDYIPMLTTMNLLYTGITRAKKYILLIGSKKKVHQIVQNIRANERLTGLKDCLLALRKSVPEEMQSVPE